MDDRSEVIARVQVLITVLLERHPDSGWFDDAIVQAYIRDKYCLSVRQMKQLTQFLENHLAQVEPASGLMQGSLFDVWEIS